MAKCKASGFGRAIKPFHSYTTAQRVTALGAQCTRLRADDIRHNGNGWGVEVLPEPVTGPGTDCPSDPAEPPAGTFTLETAGRWGWGDGADVEHDYHRASPAERRRISERAALDTTGKSATWLAEREAMCQASEAKRKANGAAAAVRMGRAAGVNRAAAWGATLPGVARAVTPHTTGGTVAKGRTKATRAAEAAAAAERLAAEREAAAMMEPAEGSDVARFAAAADDPFPWEPGGDVAHVRPVTAADLRSPEEVTAAVHGILNGRPLLTVVQGGAAAVAGVTAAPMTDEQRTRRAVNGHVNTAANRGNPTPKVSDIMGKRKGEEAAAPVAKWPVKVGGVPTCDEVTRTDSPAGSFLTF